MEKLTMKNEFVFSSSIMPYRTKVMNLPNIKLGFRYSVFSRIIKRGPGKGKLISFSRPRRASLR